MPAKPLENLKTQFLQNFHISNLEKYPLNLQIHIPQTNRHQLCILGVVAPFGCIIFTERERGFITF